MKRHLAAIGLAALLLLPVPQARAQIASARTIAASAPRGTSSAPPVAASTAASTSTPTYSGAPRNIMIACTSCHRPIQRKPGRRSSRAGADFAILQRITKADLPVRQDLARGGKLDPARAGLARKQGQAGDRIVECDGNDLGVDRDFLGNSGQGEECQEQGDSFFHEFD